MVPAGLAVLRYDENMDWEERYYLVKAEETPADEAPGIVVKGKPAEEKPAEVTPADVYPRETPGLSEIWCMDFRLLPSDGTKGKIRSCSNIPRWIRNGGASQLEVQRNG